MRGRIRGLRDELGCDHMDGAQEKRNGLSHKGGSDTGTVSEAVVVWVAYAAMLVVNILAQFGILGGRTTAEISNEVFVWFTPAGYVFTIWGIIYIALAIWLVRITGAKRIGRRLPGLPLDLRGMLFVLTCLLNVLWLTVWQFRWFSASVVVILMLTSTVWVLRVISRHRSAGRNGKGGIWDWAPLSVYAAWTTVASLANLSYVATRAAGGKISWPWSSVYTVALVLFALAAALLMKHRFGDWVFGLVILWASIGIGVRLMGVVPLTAVVVLAASVAGAVLLYLPWRRIVEWAGSLRA